jgi:hypothetical protein
MPFQLNLNIFSLCLFLPLIIIAPTSCKKLVDPGTPTNRLSSAMVYSNDSLALQALNGIYTKIMQSSCRNRSIIYQRERSKVYHYMATAC